MDCDSDMSDFEIDINNRKKVIQLEISEKRKKKSKKERFQCKTHKFAPKNANIYKYFIKFTQNYWKTRERVRVQ